MDRKAENSIVKFPIGIEINSLLKNTRNFVGIRHLLAMIVTETFYKPSYNLIDWKVLKYFIYEIIDTRIVFKTITETFQYHNRYTIASKIDVIEEGGRFLS